MFDGCLSLFPHGIILRGVVAAPDLIPLQQTSDTTIKFYFNSNGRYHPKEYHPKEYNELCYHKIIE